MVIQIPTHLVFQILRRRRRCRLISQMNFRRLANINRFVLVSSIEIMNIGASSTRMIFTFWQSCHANIVQLCNIFLKHFTPLSWHRESLCVKPKTQTTYLKPNGRNITRRAWTDRRCDSKCERLPALALCIHLGPSRFWPGSGSVHVSMVCLCVLWPGRAHRGFWGTQAARHAGTNHYDGSGSHWSWSITK